MKFDKVPELNLHLKRMTPNQAKILIKYGIKQHWDIKDFYQISEELEEYIILHSPPEPDYSELIYLQAKLLFFSGNLLKLNDIYALTAASRNVLGVQIYYALGLAFQGHSKQGLDILNQIDSEMFMNDSFVKVEFLNIKLFIYSIKRNHLKVADYYSQIIAYCDSHIESAELKAHVLPWAYLRQAYTIRSRGKVVEALDLITKCQRDLNVFPHRFFQVMVFTLLGHCHHNLGNIDEALKFYDQAIDLALETHARILLSILYNRVGMAMAGQKQPQLAKKYYQKAVTQARKAGAEWLQIGPLANLAYWKISIGAVKEAIDDFHQFIEIAASVGDERELCYAQLTLAELYRGIGDVAKTKYFLSKGFDLAVKLGLFRFVSHPEDNVDYN
ncbi:MAG: tetratricopeptide repeat protein [Candidatus Hodarchaeota archaeon]